MHVTATAPVRIADVGGWSDTWFAKSGAVCHFGVGPGVTVVAQRDASDDHSPKLRIIAPDVGADYQFEPSGEHGWTDAAPAIHPLIEQAVISVVERQPFRGMLTLTITSAVPPGASLGTSASVLVALLAATERALGKPCADMNHAERNGIAMRAHEVETGRVGREAGVQDHWAAAFGGAQLLTIAPFPAVSRERIALSETLTNQLNENVVTVIFGAHDSSAVHAKIIKQLSVASGQYQRSLPKLASLAVESAHALARDDFENWAKILTRATNTQAALDAALVGPDHTRAIAIAQECDALGWKVNGAGGAGGSLTAAFGTPNAARSYRQALQAAAPGWSIPNLFVHQGVTVTCIEPES